jgi:hypothetical protein
VRSFYPRPGPNNSSFTQTAVSGISERAVFIVDKKGKIAFKRYPLDQGIEQRKSVGRAEEER